MTHEKWIKLTQKQQRIKVADCAGKRECNCIDWNAMHEAICTLDRPMLDLFGSNLRYVLAQELKLSPCDGMIVYFNRALTATAAQLAEAFVLTMDETP